MTVKRQSPAPAAKLFTTDTDAFATRKDFLPFVPRIAFHCVRCGGHHGHVFGDRPLPTRQRWCNNGLGLKFIPKQI